MPYATFGAMVLIWYAFEKNAFEKDLEIKKKKEKIFSGQGKKNEEGCFWPRAPKPNSG